MNTVISTLTCGLLVAVSDVAGKTCCLTGAALASYRPADLLNEISR